MNWKASIGILVFGLFLKDVSADQLIAEWSFNGLTEATNPLPSSGSGQAALVGGVSGTFASGSGSSDPATAGDNAWSLSGFPAQGKAPGTAGAEFRVSTLGHHGLECRFDLRPSNTASRRVLVQYSVDGLAFTDLATFTLLAGGVFTNGLSVDLSALVAVDDNPDFALRIVSAFDEVAAYAAVNGNYGPSGTWRFDQLSIRARESVLPDGAPMVVSQPQSLERLVDATALFSVTAIGLEPLHFQWEHNGNPVAGGSGTLLALESVGLADAGEYRVVVTNMLGRVLSETAMLRVTEPEPALKLAVGFTNVLSHLIRPGDALTNTFGEQSLRSGERLEVRVGMDDPSGAAYSVEPVTPEGLPEGSGWFEVPGAGELNGATTARFVVEATPGIAGRLLEPALVIASTAGIRRIGWRVYLPTVAEQQVVVTEFLANPSGNPTSPVFNPLQRASAADRPTQHDEFLELVNFAPEPIDLGGWRIADAAATRHVFRQPTVLEGKGAVIVYGGPRNGTAPTLDVMAEPVSEGISGLSLNNDGDTIAVFNAATNLVCRVVYPGAVLGTAGSVARSPDERGGFSLRGADASLPVTPGRRADGRRFSEAAEGSEEETPGGPSGDAIRLATGTVPGVGLRLRWNAGRGTSYSVWATDSLAAGFARIASGLTFPGAEGSHDPGEEVHATRQFYRVSAP